MSLLASSDPGGLLHGARSRAPRFALPRPSIGAWGGGGCHIVNGVSSNNISRADIFDSYRSIDNRVVLDRVRVTVIAD